MTTLSSLLGSIPRLSSTSYTRYSYVATSGQTTFAATYDIGYVDVYVNGVKFVVGDDFTATNGTSIVFGTGLVAGDNVEIIAYSTFDITDALNRNTLTSEASVLALDQGVATTDSPIFVGLTLNGDVAMANNNITGLADPINNQDATNKQYVDSVLLETSRDYGLITNSPTATADYGSIT